MAVFGLAQFQSFHEIRRRRLVHAGFEKRRPSLLVPRQFIRLRRHLVWGQRHEHKCREAKNCLATVSHIDSPRPDQAGASGFTIGLTYHADTSSSVQPVHRWAPPMPTYELNSA